MNKEFIKVYILLDTEVSMRGVPIPIWRRKEIEAETLERKEKLLIWGALSYAVKDCLGMNLPSLHPHKLPTGKLVINNYHISLSHTGQYLMVAISTQNIGVDIQKDRGSTAVILATRMDDWTDSEWEIIKSQRDKDPVIGIKMWTMKESLYKFDDPGIPYDNNHKKIDTTPRQGMFALGSVDHGRARYCVCSELIKEGVEVEIQSTILDR